MSRTDKDRPAKVRLRELKVAEYHHPAIKRPLFDVPGDFKWSNKERGLGRGYIRWAKRMKAKKNRRRDVPLQKVSGRGWGDETYRLRD